MARHPWVAAADDGVRFGVQLIVPATHDALPNLLATGQRVEHLGYDACFIFDHPASHADPWIALSGLATVTERLRLGSVVNCAWSRHPAHLARLAADLDNLSRGRLLLGLGAGWWEAEFRALDIPFGTILTRQQGLAETVEIVFGAWGPAPFAYTGRHFQTGGIQIEPPPLQQPRPPLIIGGSGEQVALRLVARYADACNIQEDLPYGDRAITDEQRAAVIAHKLAALRDHCLAIGRPVDEVLRTHFTLYLLLAPTEPAAKRKLAALDTARSTSPGTRRSGKKSVLAATPERAVAYYQALRQVGIQYFVVQLDSTDEETIELLAREVAPRL